MNTVSWENATGHPSPMAFGNRPLVGHPQGYTLCHEHHGEGYRQNPDRSSPEASFHVMYGQFTADRDLEPFYRRQRFTVLDLGEPLRLESLLALPTLIASEGEERFFHRLLG